jgi:NADH-quinone oxidoreductase subunit E
VSAEKEVLITPEFEAEADTLVSHYPVSKRSAALPLLHLWQETHGHVSAQAIRWISAKLGLEQINILELVTFYPMFRQQPFGRYHIRVCRTLSCALGGGYKLFEQFCKATGATAEGGHGHLAHSPDGKFTVEFVECLAACGSAPVCMVDDDLHENVNDPTKVTALVQKCI